MKLTSSAQPAVSGTGRGHARCTAKALQSWSAVKHPAPLSRDGFHTAPPARVAQDLTDCERSLQQLHRAQQPARLGREAPPRPALERYRTK